MSAIFEKQGQATAAPRCGRPRVAGQARLAIGILASGMLAALGTTTWAQPQASHPPLGSGAAAAAPTTQERPPKGPSADDPVVRSVELLERGQAAAAIRVLETAAERDNADALFALGVLLETGVDGAPHDPEAALIAYQRAAQLGHAQAQLLVAELIRQGRFGPVDPQIADTLTQAALGTSVASRATVQGETVPGETVPAETMPEQWPLRPVGLSPPPAPAEAEAASPSEAELTARKADATPRAGPGREPTDGDPGESTAARSAGASAGWRIWVGSMRTAAGAERLRAEVAARLEEVGKPQDLVIHPHRLATGRVQRVYGAPLPGKAAAEALCSEILAAAGDLECLVIRD